MHLFQPRLILPGRADNQGKPSTGDSHGRGSRWLMASGWKSWADLFGHQPHGALVLCFWSLDGTDEWAQRWGKWARCWHTSVNFLTRNSMKLTSMFWVPIVGKASTQTSECDIIQAMVHLEDITAFPSESAVSSLQRELVSCGKGTVFGILALLTSCGMLDGQLTSPCPVHLCTLYWLWFAVNMHDVAHKGSSAMRGAKENSEN